MKKLLSGLVAAVTLSVPGVVSADHRPLYCARGFDYDKPWTTLTSRCRGLDNQHKQRAVLRLRNRATDEVVFRYGFNENGDPWTLHDGKPSRVSYRHTIWLVEFAGTVIQDR